MFGKALKALRVGHRLADPATWKNRQTAANAVLAALALAVSMTPNLEINDADLALIAGGIAAVVNIVLTIVTSKKVGLKEEK